MGHVGFQEAHDPPLTIITSNFAESTSTPCLLHVSYVVQLFASLIQNILVVSFLMSILGMQD